VVACRKATDPAKGNLWTKRRTPAGSDGRKKRAGFLPPKAEHGTDLVDLYREIVSAYEAERVWVVQDNAPFHFHTDVLQELEAQVWPRAYPAFEYPLPSQWPDPTEAASAEGELPVQIVPLPTYASWLMAI
jgi:hypothetical protein